MIYSSGEQRKEISLKIKTLIIDEKSPNLIAEDLFKGVVS